MLARLLRTGLFLLLVCSTVHAQPILDRYILIAPEKEAEEGDGRQRWVFPVVQTIRHPEQPLLAYTLEWQGNHPGGAPAVRIAIQWRQAEEPWSDWQVLTWDTHTGDGTGRFFTDLIFVPGDISALRVQLLGPVVLFDPLPPVLYLHQIAPGRSPAGQPAGPAGLRGDRCSCAAPLAILRETWCPGGSCPPHPAPQPTTPTHLIVHHSAGTNQSADWPAVVRSIWSYHVQINGWSDIGYHWLIDPLGQLYQGRADHTVGAHFCGQNSQSLGICLLGDFTATVPSTPARDRLTQFLAWKGCALGAHPLESSLHAPSQLLLPHVSGHRDGCNTSCPGHAFYPLLHALRDAVAGAIRSGCACPLVAPADVQASREGTGVRVRWLPGGPDVLYYQVTRQEADLLPGQLLAETILPFFTDTSAEAGKAYQYRVRAVDKWCASGYSLPALVGAAGETTWVARLEGDILAVTLDNGEPGPVSLSLYYTDGRLAWEQSFSKPGQRMELSLPMPVWGAGLWLLRVRQGSRDQWIRLVRI